MTYASGNRHNSIGGVMMSMLASSAVDLGFKPRSGHCKDLASICCIAVNHLAFTNWRAENQDNESEWSDMSICGLLLSELEL